MRAAILISTSIALAASGCAKRPEDVVATYHSPQFYSGWSCPQLQAEYQSVASKVAQYADAQDDAATRDAVVMGVGLVLFWPALFVLAAGDEKEELAAMKGKYEAVTAQMAAQNCPIPQPTSAKALVEAGVAVPPESPVAPVQTQAAAPAAEPAGARPVEGASLRSFTEAQMSRWCTEGWEVRTSADGRTEYNPCKRREMFL